MTLTLELALETERALEAAARSQGQSAADYAAALLNYAVRVAPQHIPDVKRQAEIAARLAALDAIPSYNTRAGLPEIEDTSRTAEPDIYGYSEREAEQL